MESYAALVRELGEKAPGPIERLYVPPRPEVLLAQPYYVFHPFGIEWGRSNTLKRVAERASRIDALLDTPVDAAKRTLQAIPGVGIWTAEMVAGKGMGDPDAVPVGDLKLPGLVGWALARENDADDERMLELLEPFSGNRWLVIKLLHDAGVSRPRGVHRG